MDYDLIIIGGGCAGLSGAMYAGRMHLKTLILLGDLPGGTITTTDVVENYPGFTRLTGKELGDKLLAHAKEYSEFVTFLDESATALAKTQGGFRVTAAGKDYSGRTVLLATGMKHRELGVPGEKELWARGVHNCALCDGAFYKGKRIAIVGGSDSAAKEALLLTQWASAVLVLARSTLHPEPVNAKRVSENAKIEVHEGVQVREIKGAKGAKGITAVSAVVTDVPVNGSTTVPVDAVFVAVGADPVTALAKAVGVALNKKGEVLIDRNAATNVPGFYAAGDCADTRFKQAITGAAEAVLAVYSAYSYINERPAPSPAAPAKAKPRSAKRI